MCTPGPHELRHLRGAKRPDALSVGRFPLCCVRRGDNTCAAVSIDGRERGGDEAPACNIENT